MLHEELTIHPRYIDPIEILVEVYFIEYKLGE
jgi:hypothetical protein